MKKNIPVASPCCQLFNSCHCPGHGAQAPHASVGPGSRPSCHRLWLHSREWAAAVATRRWRLAAARVVLAATRCSQGGLCSRPLILQFHLVTQPPGQAHTGLALWWSLLWYLEMLLVCVLIIIPFWCLPPPGHLFRSSVDVNFTQLSVCLLASPSALPSMASCLSQWNL